MTQVNHARTYEQDDTLSKLKRALEEADGVDMRSAIEGAIEDRKEEIRRESPSQLGD